MRLDILKACIITLLIGVSIPKTIIAQKQVSKQLFTPAQQMELKTRISNTLNGSINKLQDYNADSSNHFQQSQRIDLINSNGDYSVDYTILINSFRPHFIHNIDGKKLLDYYGSGDINNDELIDSLDLIEMISGSQSYRSDINGNGLFSDQEDVALMDRYLNQEIDYLPGHWQYLRTKEERIEWIEKVLILESDLKSTQPIQNAKDSFFVATQSFINFTGINNIKGLIRYWRDHNINNTVDTTHNSFFNLPIFQLFEPIGEPSGFIVPVEVKALVILVGDNPLNFEDWYMWNYKTNSQLTIEDSRFNGNSYIGLAIYWYFYDTYEGRGFYDWYSRILSWNMSNKQQVDLRYFEAAFQRNSPHNSELILTAPRDTTIYRRINYLLSDDYGSPSVASYPLEGQDFYWEEYIDGVHDWLVKGEIKNDIEKSIVDTTYLNPDSTIFTLKKKFVGTQFEIDSSGRRDLGFFNEFKFILDKDSVCQNITVDLTTSIKEESLIKNFALVQNYPNPFNPITKIKYQIPHNNLVQLVVYDILGRKVTTLVNEQKPAGSYEVEFIASQFSSGVYFYELRAGDFRDVKKLILLK